MPEVPLSRVGKYPPCFYNSARRVKKARSDFRFGDIIGSMRVVERVMSRGELKQSEKVFDEMMVKGVVDVEKGILAIDADLHADLEKMLLDAGSSQDDLWGINLWFEDGGEDFVEFDSMINVRPRQGNRSRGVENPEVRAKIIEVVGRWIQ